MSILDEERSDSMAKETLEILTESMFYVLMALLKQPKCGTEIAQFVLEKTKKRVEIGPGTLYTILSKFEQSEYIEEIAVEGRKRTYQITDIGKKETGIYAASGHDMQRFEIEKSGSLRLAEGIYEQFDESGNAAYTMKKGEETDVITEEEYYAAFEKYSNATIVNFSYGASDAGKAEVVTNNELEPRQGNIAEDVNVLEIVQETASEFAVKKMETSYF